MSFGENKPEVIKRLQDENKQLRMVSKFMLERMLDDGFNERCPASWSYIRKELMKVER